MKYIIDTHVFLWIVEDNPQLSTKARAIYLNEDNKILLSMASVWEIAIKSSLKKLELPGSLSDFVQNHIRANNISLLSNQKVVRGDDIVDNDEKLNVTMTVIKWK
jgi:PIN domain nuclease of toxin-antitoxin system